MARFGRRRGPLQRTKAGVVITLGEDERAFLGGLLGDLRQALLAGTEHPGLRRLFPPAYHLPADAEAEAEYQRLMHDELVASRLTSLTTAVEALSSSAPMSPAATNAFLGSLNQIRLALGTTLDVGEDDELSAQIGSDNPNAAEFHLYHYLSWLLDASLDCL